MSIQPSAMRFSTWLLDGVRADGRRRVDREIRPRSNTHVLFHPSYMLEACSETLHISVLPCNTILQCDKQFRTSRFDRAVTKLCSAIRDRYIDRGAANTMNWVHSFSACLVAVRSSSLTLALNVAGTCRPTRDLRALACRDGLA